MADVAQDQEVRQQAQRVPEPPAAVPDRRGEHQLRRAKHQGHAREEIVLRLAGTMEIAQKADRAGDEERTGEAFQGDGGRRVLAGLYHLRQPIGKGESPETECETS